MDFLKGHGTENDFVLLPDPAGALDLTPSRVRALCDRHRGLGADGVLRVVPGRLVDDAPAGTDQAGWFMDYRNADGTVAEMCGNGVRLFARYLADAGLVDGREFSVGSRSGPRAVRLHPDGTVSVQMGPVRLGDPGTVTVSGDAFDAVSVDVGNPHLVCITDVATDAIDLTVPPGHDPAAFPNGVNVEFVNLVGDTPGQLKLRMRVHERGVGETRSCGTGTVAAAAAALRHTGQPVGDAEVSVPGGELRIAVTAEGSELTGPAVVVARGRIDPDWWASLG